MRLAILFGFIFLASLLTPLTPANSTQNSNELIVGLTGKYPPFNYFDEKGKLTGFDVDIANDLCQQIHRTCVFKVLQWDGILSALLSHRIDAIIASMAITPGRSKKALFTPSYYESGAQLFVKESAKSASPNTPGFKIGVTLGTTYGEFAKKEFKEAEVRTYKGDVEIFQEITHGRLDGMITDRMVGLYLNKIHEAGLKPVGKLLYEERIGIPVAKEDPKLHQKLSEALKNLRESPRYSTYFSKYFGETTNAQDSGNVPWTFALGLLLKALGNTILLSISGIGLGILASGLFAFLMIQNPFKLAVPTQLWVDFIRSTPFLVQVFALYFGLPSLGVSLSPWSAAILAIAVHSSAYLSEILKVAYLAIPWGQKMATRTLGLTPVQSFRHVIFPQMLPLIAAPFLNTTVAMIKDSAIVSVISVHELTLQAQELIGTTFEPLKYYFLAAVLYFLITYPLLVFGKKAETLFKKRGLLHA